MVDPMVDPMAGHMRAAAELVSFAVKRVNDTNFGMPRSCVMMPEHRRMLPICTFDESMTVRSYGWLLYVHEKTPPLRPGKGVVFPTRSFTIDANTGEITEGILEVYNATEAVCRDGRGSPTGRRAIGILNPNWTRTLVKMLEIEEVSDIRTLPWDIRMRDVYVNNWNGETVLTVMHFGKLLFSRIGERMLYRDELDVGWTCAEKVGAELNNEWRCGKIEHGFTLTHKTDRENVYRYDIARIRGHAAIGVVIDGDQHSVYWHLGTMRVLIGEFTDKTHWRHVELLSWRLFVVYPHRQLFAIV